MTTDMAVAIASGAIAFMAAAFITLNQRHGAMAQDVKYTRDQVENTHQTNLRDDIDALHEAVQVTLRGVEGLREELRMERKERMHLAQYVAEVVVSRTTSSH